MDKLDSASLVIVGAMNPPIHHPSWYKNAGLISPDVEAIAIQQAVVTPQIAQFKTSDFKLTCVPDRWIIEATNLESIEWVVLLGIRAFDDKLHETPINALGLNLAFHRKVGGLAKESLARKVEATRIVRQDIGICSASIQFEVLESGKTVKVRVEPSGHKEDCVLVSFNFHHDTRDFVDSTGHFKVSDVISKESLARERSVANTLVDQIIASIAFEGV